MAARIRCIRLYRSWLAGTALFLIGILGVTAQGTILLRRISGAFSMVERSNLARYDNGKYIGHVYREIRYQLNPITDAGGNRYRGTAYVYEQTLRDLQQSARLIDAVIPLELSIGSRGELNIEHDTGYPVLRNFPLFPDTPVVAGTSWVAQGQRMIDPRNDGNPVLMPILVQYVFKGEELYQGEQVFRITAQYATRYKTTAGSTPKARASGAFIEASGSHAVDILVRVRDGRPVLMRDTLDETFTWADGSTVRFKGFTLTFSDSYLPFDKGALIADMSRVMTGSNSGSASQGTPAVSGADVKAGTAESGAVETAGFTGGTTGMDGVSSGSTGSDRPGLTKFGNEPLLVMPEQNVEIASVPEGIKLIIKDIRFVADSDQILKGEEGRLDLIAKALLRAVAEAADSQGSSSVLVSGGAKKLLFLVEGHTAAVGKPQGELELSQRRAKRIVDELVARGIPADRFIYKGWGGSRPLADNSTEAGRAQNRRVEITILQ
ncbi:MAG: OmpA family protein [Termitinemataceae bacterium]